MTYQHKVQYYETDKQGVTHHSNYIRFMEETRVDIMERMGFGYEKMEAVGIVSPVIGVTCDYLRPTTFPDVIDIKISVRELSRLKVRFGYEMTVGGKTVCRGTSQHCFLNKSGRPVAVEEAFPDFHAFLLTIKEEQ